MSGFHSRINRVQGRKLQPVFVQERLDAVHAELEKQTARSKESASRMEDRPILQNLAWMEGADALKNQARIKGTEALNEAVAMSDLNVKSYYDMMSDQFDQMQAILLAVPADRQKKEYDRKISELMDAAGLSSSADQQTGTSGGATGEKANDAARARKVEEGNELGPEAESIRKIKDLMVAAKTSSEWSRGMASSQDSWRGNGWKDSAQRLKISQATIDKAGESRAAQIARGLVSASRQRMLREFCERMDGVDIDNVEQKIFATLDRDIKEVERIIQKLEKNRSDIRNALSVKTPAALGIAKIAADVMPSHHQMMYDAFKMFRGKVAAVENMKDVDKASLSQKLAGVSDMVAAAHPLRAEGMALYREIKVSGGSEPNGQVEPKWQIGSNSTPEPDRQVELSGIIESKRELEPNTYFDSNRKLEPNRFIQKDKASDRFAAWLKAVTGVTLRNPMRRPARPSANG